MKTSKKKKIILYRSHSQRFILFEGTDLDIQTALIEAGNQLSEVVDVTTLLNKYFQFAPVFAKLYSYEKGTPRFFEFVISEYPITKIPTGEIDGFVNLIFNSKIKVGDNEAISVEICTSSGVSPETRNSFIFLILQRILLPILHCIFYEEQILMLALTILQR